MLCRWCINNQEDMLRHWCKVIREIAGCCLQIGAFERESAVCWVGALFRNGIRDITIYTTSFTTKRRASRLEVNPRRSVVEKVKELSFR